MTYDEAIQKLTRDVLIELMSIVRIRGNSIDSDFAWAEMIQVNGTNSAIDVDCIHEYDDEYWYNQPRAAITGKEPTK